MKTQRSEITQQDLLELLDYDASTGVFTWKKKRRGVAVGKPLGTCNGKGYLRITVCGFSFYAHRLAWLYMHGDWPEDEIDHINGVTSDNRISNLRSVSGAQNAHNKQKAAGVSWHKKANKWQVHISVRRKRSYLGLFDSFESARLKYIEAKKEMTNVCL